MFRFTADHHSDKIGKQEWFMGRQSSCSGCFLLALIGGAVIIGASFLAVILDSVEPLPASDKQPEPSIAAPQAAGPGSAAEAYAITRQFVRDQLLAPRTAKFPRSATNTRELAPGRFEVRAYVDSHNAFGAMIRTKFIAVVETRDGTTWSLVSLDI